jgi:hypothetical protein
MTTLLRIAYRTGGSARWEWRLTLACEAIEAPAQIETLERMGYLAFSVPDTVTEFDLPQTWDTGQEVSGVVNTYGDSYCAGQLRRGSYAG